MSTTAVRTFQSSDLSRNPGAVFSAAEGSPVLLTRRDGESLVLMNESELSQQTWLLDFASRLVTAMSDDRGELVDRMCQQFSWMLALDNDARIECSSELIEAARAALSTGVARPAYIRFSSWFDSASSIAEGFDKIPVDWVDANIAIARP